MTQENVASLTNHQPRPKMLEERFADRFGVDANKLMGTLKSTCFKTRDRAPTNEEMMALLVVADQYGLNPFTREIFAFPDKQNGIVPVVGVDGWSRIINEHKHLNGIEFRYAEKPVTMDGARPCPEWCEAVIYRKDRDRPTVVREYLDEAYRPPFTYPDGNKKKGPWQTHTKRFLRHKALIQCARIAFGFAGIYDEDEARDIINVTPNDDSAPPPRPQREDFEPKVADLHTLIDEFGESMGEFYERDLIQNAIDKIEGFTDLETLNAFMDHNDGFEAFEPRSEARQAIAGAYNAARGENLMAAQNDAPPQESNDTPAPTGEPEQGWEDWSDNLVDQIKMIENKGGLDNLWATHKARLEALKAEAPALHTSVINAFNARLGEVTAPQNQE